jgi:hypothetical protein
MRSFEINGVSVLVAYGWRISDVINSRSVFDGIIVDKQSLSAIETGQEIIIASTEGNARDIGDGTFTRTSNATMQDGTIVTANVTRYETGQFGQAVMVEEGTTNLLTVNQTDVETDTTGFSLFGTGTLTRDTTAFWSNAASAKAVSTLAGSQQMSIYTGSLRTPVNPNTIYTFSVYAKAQAGVGRQWGLDIEWFDAGEALIAGGIIGPYSDVSATWTRLSVTGQSPATAVTCYVSVNMFNTQQNEVLWWDGAQLEAKSYATSWIQGGVTRAAETLTIPTAGVVSAAEGTVEFWIYLDGDIAATNSSYRTMFVLSTSGSTTTNIIIFQRTTVADTWQIRSADSAGYTGNLFTWIPVVGWHYFVLRWSVIELAAFIDGVKYGSVLNPKLPTSLPVNAYVGSWITGAQQINTLIDDLRISNIARTDAEILAAYNSGVALPVDQYTTAKMAFDGKLEIFARPIIFAGTIDAPEAIESDPGYLYYPITAVDYNQIADKRLYAASHINTLAGNIVSAIISAKLSAEGITAGSIEDGPTITKANFNYKKCSEALDYLKDVTGMNWNIDFNKKLNFFGNSTNLAPWILNNTVQHTNFRIKKNRSQYRNRQYVRAGTGKTTLQTLEKPSPAPDGSSRSFVLRFPVAEKPVIFINSTAVLSANVGVNGLDTGKSWYFSYNSNVVSQNSGTAVLTSGTTLEITYTGLYPIIMLVDDPAQIAARAAVETGTSGIYENLHTEKSINERSQAIEYTEGLILRYGIIPSTITFDTEVPGLQAGQLLPIQKTLFGINSSYLIESVDISAADSDKTIYSIKCLDGSALGGWEQFFRDLLKGNQEYIIQENEVIVTLNVQTETEKWGSETTIKIYNTSLYGLTWNLIQRLGTETDILSLSHLGSGIVIAGTENTGQIYKSIDYGATWTLIQQLGTENYVLSLSYLGSGIVIAGTYPTGQIYKSIDYGATWSLIQRLGTETQVLSLSYLGSGIVIAGTGPTGQIYKSIDYGATWTLIQRLGTETSVRSLSYLDSGIVIAGTGPTGQIYKSIDYGATWTLIQQLGTENYVLSLSYLGSGIVIAGTYPTGQIYKSTDYGATWSLIQRLGTEVQVFSLSYLGSGIVIAGTGTSGQIYKSIDYGATWSLIQRLGMEDNVQSLSYLGSGIVIAGTGTSGRIYKSITTPTTEVLHD